MLSLQCYVFVLRVAPIRMDTNLWQYTFIVLSHGETRPTAPWPKFPTWSHYLDTLNGSGLKYHIVLQLHNRMALSFCQCIHTGTYMRDHWEIIERSMRSLSVPWGFFDDRWEIVLDRIKALQRPWGPWISLNDYWEIIKRSWWLLDDRWLLFERSLRDLVILFYRSTISQRSWPPCKGGFFS